MVVKKIFQGVFKRDTLSSLDVEKLECIIGRYCKILIECDVPDPRDLQSATIKLSTEARDLLRDYVKGEGITYDKGIDYLVKKEKASKEEMIDIRE